MCLCVSVLAAAVGPRERRPGTIAGCIGISVARGQIAGKSRVDWGVRGWDRGLWVVRGFVDWPVTPSRGLTESTRIGQELQAMGLQTAALGPVHRRTKVTAKQNCRSEFCGGDGA